MLSGRNESGAPPKRRVTTYGKAGKRHLAAMSKASSAKKENATLSSSTAKATASPPSSPSEAARPRVTSTTRKAGGYNRTGRSNDTNTVQSQPLSGDAISDRLGPKKRKLTRSQSDTREKSAGAYSTPDSSPNGSFSAANADLDELDELQGPPRKKSKSPRCNLEGNASVKTDSKTAARAPIAEADPYAFDDLPPPKRVKPQLSWAKKDVSVQSNQAKPSQKKLVQRSEESDDPFAFDDSPPRKKANPPARNKVPSVIPARSESASRQTQHQIPLRLSRDNPSRPAGTTKRQPSPAPIRAVKQTKVPASVIQFTQTKLNFPARSVTPAVATTKTRSPSPFESSEPEKPIFHSQRKATNPPKGRKRLIDALASQETDSSSEDEEADSQPTQETYLSQLPEIVFATAPPSAMRPKNVLCTLSSKRPGPKFTYGAGKMTVVDEDVMMGDTGLGGSGLVSSKATFIDFSNLAGASEANNTFSYEDEDEDLGNSGAVRSIHELRQAGANSRFADEMADILDRFGIPSAKPSSMRRGALLELAEKMPEKDFRRQFRNHGDRGTLFDHLDKESDIISGFAILSILVALLGTSNSTHLVQQLKAQDVGVLLTRTLKETQDIRQIAKDKKTNATKNMQSTLLKVKESMIKLSIWEPAKPTSLSPRTMALKCLELIIRQSANVDSNDEIFSPIVTEVLFSILSVGVGKDSSWDFPTQQDSNDFYLALFLLEGHSVIAMQSHQASKWTNDYAPIIADVLETALRRRCLSDKSDEIQSEVLKLVLNITNSNPGAIGLFIDRGLLHGIAHAACTSFDAVLPPSGNGATHSKTIDSLILLVGIMINFCEHYGPSTANLAQLTDDNASVSRLIQVFLDRRTSNAKTEENSALNVPFGWLSILLGYLCLNDSIRDRFEAIHGRMTLGPLVHAMRELVTYHEVVSQTTASQQGSQEKTSTQQRLENLIDQLENPSS